jgi:hypothetical protein
MGHEIAGRAAPILREQDWTERRTRGTEGLSLSTQRGVGMRSVEFLGGKPSTYVRITQSRWGTDAGNRARAGPRRRPLAHLGHRRGTRRRRISRHGVERRCAAEDQLGFALAGRTAVLVGAGAVP